MHWSAARRGSCHCPLSGTKRCNRRRQCPNGIAAGRRRLGRLSRPLALRPARRPRIALHPGGDGDRPGHSGHPDRRSGSTPDRRRPMARICGALFVRRCEPRSHDLFAAVAWPLQSDHCGAGGSGTSGRRSRRDPDRRWQHCRGHPHDDDGDSPRDQPRRSGARPRPRHHLAGLDFFDQWDRAFRRPSREAGGAMIPLLRAAAIGWLLLSAAAFPAVAEPPFITVASTTSTEESGLFGYLLPAFTKETGIDVRVVAVGTGQALKIGERGDCDVVFVHDRPAELAFVEHGFGIDRREVMYNDFVLIGPASDPAHVDRGTDIVAALRKIADAKAPFVARGDDSGTSKAELRFWKEAGLDPKAISGAWYRDTGSGMGPTLNTAAAMDGYTLSDRGTWLNFKNRQNLSRTSRNQTGDFED